MNIIPVFFYRVRILLITKHEDSKLLTYWILLIIVLQKINNDKLLISNFILHYRTTEYLILKMAHLRHFTHATITFSEYQKNERRSFTTIILLDFINLHYQLTLIYVEIFRLNCQFKSSWYNILLFFFFLNYW